MEGRLGDSGDDVVAAGHYKMRPCYGVVCDPYEDDHQDPANWRSCCSCYSPSCRRRHKRSYWRHPKIKKMLMRAKISCALRVRERLPPFASFVPRSLHEYLIQIAKSTNEEIPFGGTKYGVVLFADASGFTKLTERLVAKMETNTGKQGAQRGAEVLCSILNTFFTILVTIIHKHGGDIIKFAGDALSVVWFIGDEEGQARSQTEAAMWACQASMEIHKRLHNYVAVEASEEDPEPILLSMHMGIGCGQFTCIHVGGVFGRWEYVVSGPPMKQIAIAEPLALSGETVVSPEAWRLVERKAVGTPMTTLVKTERKQYPTEGYQMTFMRLDELKQTIPLPSAPEMKLTHKHINLLRRYIPAAVQPRLLAEQIDHLGDLRNVSVVFVNCSGLDICADDTGHCWEAIEHAQQLMLTVQQTIYSWEGSINKFLVDDKGLLVLCVFGLPPLAHVDDSKRAVAAALRLTIALKELGPEVSCQVGVTTGAVFCGVVGSPDRREYTVMGEAVNLSARLMCAAAPGTVLVDYNTMIASKGYVQYDNKPDLILKGIEEPVRNYRPIKMTYTKKKEASARTLALRKKEYQILRKMIGNGILSGTIVLTGERGSGKSALVTAIKDICDAKGLQCLRGNNNKKNATQKDNPICSLSEILSLTKGRKNADSMVEPLKRFLMEGPSFSAWQNVFSSLIEKGAEMANMTKSDWILSVLPDADRPHAALLNIMFPEGLNIPLPPMGDTPRPDGPHKTTNGLDGLREIPFWNLNLSDRIRRLKHILVCLIESFCSKCNTCIVLHLQTGTSMQATVGPESWSLAHRVSQLCKKRTPLQNKLILCIVSRPLVNYAPVEFIEIVECARQQHMLLQLKPLSKKERYSFLVETLGAAPFPPLPEDLVTFVSDYAAGNPKHIEELVNELVNSNHVTVKSEGSVEVNVEDFRQVVIPAKIIGTIKMQIDLLQSRHQLIVKVASTCNYFSLQMLSDIFPYEKEKHRLPSVLQESVESGIFTEHTGDDIPAEVLAFHPEATKCYSFHSKIMQEQANEMLLHENRRELEHQRNKMAVMNTVRCIIQIQEKTRAWLASGYRARSSAVVPLGRKPGMRKIKRQPSDPGEMMGIPVSDC